MAADVPAGLLARRPDILAAKHALRAANADTGVARATFFPQISLTAFTGFASTSLTGLFAGPLAWSVSPQLNAPLFTAGRNRASLDEAKVRKRIEVPRYEQSIQGAFREVADALAGAERPDIGSSCPAGGRDSPFVSVIPWGCGWARRLLVHRA